MSIIISLIFFIVSSNITFLVMYMIRLFGFSVALRT